MEHELQPPELEAAIHLGTSSCFREVQTLQHVHILPSYIGRVSDGVISLLNSQILRYSKEYGGVVLAYSRPVVMGSQGLIVDEQPHVHFNVKVSLYLFKPSVNAILRGTVNSISTAHVGCLVYNCFNASVLAPTNSYNARTSNGLFSNQLQVGTQIWFRVTKLEASEVLFIQGVYEGMVGEEGVGVSGADWPHSPVLETRADDAVAGKGRRKKKATKAVKATHVPHRTK